VGNKKLLILCHFKKYNTLNLFSIGQRAHFEALRNITKNLFSDIII